MCNFIALRIGLGNFIGICCLRTMHFQFLVWLLGVENYSGETEVKEIFNWLVLSDEQMRKNLPFFLLNDEQINGQLGVEHLPVK